MLPPLPGSGQERRVAGGIAAAATQTSEQSSRVHVCLIPLLRDACVSTCEPADAGLCVYVSLQATSETAFQNPKRICFAGLNKTQPSSLQSLQDPARVLLPSLVWFVYLLLSFFKTQPREVQFIFAWAAAMLKIWKNLAGPCPAPTYLPTYLPYLWETKKEIMGRVKVGY